MKNYAGQRFGRWLVVKEIVGVRLTTRQGRYWLLRCDCGKERVMPLSNVLRGDSTSCGCAKEDWITARILPNAQAIKNRLLRAYQLSAKKQNLVWELSDVLFFNLIAENCHYCGVAPITLKQRSGQTLAYNGIDRKDNAVGYKEENVVACCKTCNYLKRAMSYEEFVDYLNRVASFRSNRWVKTAGA